MFKKNIASRTVDDQEVLQQLFIDEDKRKQNIINTIHPALTTWED